MKKEIVFILLFLFVISLFSGIVSASLYAEKIPDPSRFTSINPLWSSILEKQDGSNITLSLIEFEWLNPDGQTSKTTMFYLNDGVDEYIADKSSFSYAQEYDSGCSDEDLYNSCISDCKSDESCIDQCMRDYQCDFAITCTQNGPDGTCGLKKSTSSYGSNDIVLNFNPSTGQLDNSQDYSLKCKGLVKNSLCHSNNSTFFRHIQTGSKGSTDEEPIIVGDLEITTNFPHEIDLNQEFDFNMEITNPTNQPIDIEYEFRLNSSKLVFYEQIFLDNFEGAIPNYCKSGKCYNITISPGETKILNGRFRGIKPNFFNEGITHRFFLRLISTNQNLILDS